MARFHANENFPLRTVHELRRLGHDVLTSFEAGNSNRSVPGEEVLAFAAGEQRILLSQNRLHFMRPSTSAVPSHTLASSSVLTIPTSGGWLSGSMK
jgi:Domain of unknown function (DUF5615)